MCFIQHNVACPVKIIHYHLLDRSRSSSFYFFALTTSTPRTFSVFWTLLCFSSDPLLSQFLKIYPWGLAAVLDILTPRRTSKIVFVATFLIQPPILVPPRSILHAICSLGLSLHLFPVNTRCPTNCTIHMTVLCIFACSTPATCRALVKLLGGPATNYSHPSV